MMTMSHMMSAQSPRNRGAMALPFLTLPPPYAGGNPASSVSAVPVAPVVPLSSQPSQRLPARAHAAAAVSHPSAALKKITKKSAPPQKKVRSSKSNIPGSSRYWTPSEHRLFVIALLKYGPKDLKRIAAYVGTRNMIQCRTHEQKCFMRLMREAQRETDLRGAAMVAANSSRQSSSSGDTDSMATACSMEVDAADSCSSELATNHKKPAPAPALPVRPKEVYSVPSSCGITLLSVVGDELSRALSS